jgi:hypothetical protein
MKKTIGGVAALLASLTMVSAFADCGCGKKKGKVMGAVANAPVPAVQAAPAAPTPATNAVPDEVKKTVVAAPQETLSAEDDAEDDDE